MERRQLGFAELIFIANSHLLVRIDDDEIGIGADLQRTFSRIESEQPRGVCAAGAHNARIVECALLYEPEHHGQKGLHARKPARCFPYVICTGGLFIGVMRGVVGGHHIEHT